MHDLVKKKRLSITRIFCLSITKIKTLWREKVVTNYPFTRLKIAVNLYEFGILTNKSHFSFCLLSCVSIDI